MDAIGLEPGDIKSIDDLSKLPFTTKDDLRRRVSLRYDLRTDGRSCSCTCVFRHHREADCSGGHSENDIDLWVKSWHVP